jgi:prepilin-type N-terminal cleavage/methylation domain-containing protein
MVFKTTSTERKLQVEGCKLQVLTRNSRRHKEADGTRLELNPPPYVGGYMQSRAGFTLVEMMVASGVGAIVLTGLMLMFWFSNRSFASLANYLDLDQKTQVALDKMSREIRQVNMLTAFSPTNLTFQDWDGATLQYTYDPNSQTLTRNKGNTNITTLLTGCDSLQFSIFQRTPNTNTFEPVSTFTVTDTKVIELTWNCSRKILGNTANTESMESAKIVIRKK